MTSPLSARSCDSSPQRIVEMRPDVPPPLQDIVSRALSKDVNARYGSATEGEWISRPTVRRRHRHPPGST